MPVSRVKVKNRHVKKKPPLTITLHKPASKFAGALLIASTLTTAQELVPAHDDETFVQAATVSSKEAFIENIAASAKPIADANGLYPSVMIAQAILESDWGTSSLSRAPYYNLFGIQGSYEGQSVTFKTQEYINKKWETVNRPFRKYPSYTASFEDNAWVLKTTNFGNGYYYAKAWRANARTYQQATAALTGRYATDPNYGASLNAIIAEYDLTRYDGGSSANSASAAEATSSSALTTTVYTVKAGDTLSAISRKYGVTVAQIQSWNKLKSTLIYIGQKLKVEGRTTNTKTAAPASTAAVKSTSTKATTTKTTKVKVKSGDTLWALATHHHTSVAQLKKWNHLTSDTIYVGQTLIVAESTTAAPAKVAAPSSKSTTKKTTSSTKGEVIHKVVSGDTLWGLARSYDSNVASIEAWNHLSSDVIIIGQYLRVR